MTPPRLRQRDALLALLADDPATRVHLVLCVEVRRYRRRARGANRARRAQACPMDGDWMAIGWRLISIDDCELRHA
jgi:hypothetical protein